ncbi:MAG: hypothetical protein EKK48_07515 [Candidatus Melainabacteria bacterium]|nr:MAG: hypothetical protein EKK48_07515 [Candidatus Melainabacteria bacterium]
MQNRRLSAAIAALIFSSSNGCAIAADWGYDESKQPTELKASPAKSLQPRSGNPFARTAAPKAVPKAESASPETLEGASAGSAQALVPLKASPAALTAPAKPTAHPPAKPSSTKSTARGSTPTPTAKSRAAVSPGKSNGAIEDWIELFELVSKEQVTAEQKARYREALAHKLTTERGAEVSQITTFWPEVRGRIKNNEDEKTAFASLFRALLRFVLKSKNVTEDDSTILSELLGPERISVPGDPPLTEDSVDAYGDMACFMYEQSHPGKSVDAIDNRTVFASVIARKYSEAPTEKDKRAMSNFSLSWAKFKVMWLAANESDRKQLYEQIAMGKPPASDIKDPLVTAIFANGPWR